jgi:hypothetical protein
MDSIYPNKAPNKTTKSVLDTQIEVAEQQSKNKAGISFYRNKLHDFVFIPNTQEQQFKQWNP